MKNYILTSFLIIIITFLFSCTGIRYNPPLLHQKLLYPKPSILWEKSVNGELIFTKKFQTYMNHERDILIFVVNKENSGNSYKDIVCMELSTSKVLWHVPLPTKEIKKIVVDPTKSFLLFISKSEKKELGLDHQFVALNAVTGDILWNHNMQFYKEIQYDFIMDSEYFIVMTFETLEEGLRPKILSPRTRKGKIYMFNSGTGQIRWTREFSNAFRPFLIKDKIIVPSGYFTLDKFGQGYWKTYDRIVAVNKFTGKNNWEIQSLHSAVDRLDDRLFIYNRIKNIISLYDLNNGIEISSVDFHSYTKPNEPAIEVEIFPSFEESSYYLVYDPLKYTIKEIPLYPLWFHPGLDVYKINYDSLFYLAKGGKNLILMDFKKNTSKILEIKELVTQEIKNIFVLNDTITIFNNEPQTINVYQFDKNGLSVTPIKNIETDYIGSWNVWRDFNNNIISPTKKPLIYNLRSMKLLSYELKIDYGYFDYTTWSYLRINKTNSTEPSYTLVVYDLLNNKISYEIPVGNKHINRWIMNAHDYTEPMEILTTFNTWEQIHLLRETHGFKIDGYTYPIKIDNQLLITYHIAKTKNITETKFIAYLLPNSDN